MDSEWPKLKFFSCFLLLNDFVFNLGFLVYRMEIMPAWKLCHTPRDSNNSHHRSHQPCPARPWPKHVCFLSYRKPSHKESALLLHRDQKRHDPLLQVLKRSQTICPKPSVQQNWNHVSKSFQHTHPTWNLVAISPSRQLACTGSWLLYKSVSSFFLP